MMKAALPVLQGGNARHSVSLLFINSDSKGAC